MLPPKISNAEKATAVKTGNLEKQMFVSMLFDGVSAVSPLGELFLYRALPCVLEGGPYRRESAEGSFTKSVSANKFLTRVSRRPDL